MNTQVEWIPVEKTLPPVQKRVLVVAFVGGHRHVGISSIMSIRQNGTPKWCNYSNSVTHWATMPELPD